LRMNMMISYQELVRTFPNIYGKLGLHSIVELIDYAKLYELI
ncbi:fimbriae biosynthesis transcriptional regulator FimZ, partial [Escherichia coli]|nr:fimbriae biosynthesis transcriptional regulator FimZ [Escherichia coli]